MTSSVSPTYSYPDVATSAQPPPPGDGINLNKISIGPETKYFTNCKGQNLHCCYWKPKGKVRGLAFVCHGFGEHLQWYEDLALRLSSCRVLTFGHDHVGHGLSEGIRGHVSSVEEYIKDVISHCNSMKNIYEDKPCFLIGHSMGGMISIRAAMSNPMSFAGVVLIGPLIQPNPEEATPFKLCVAKVISSMLPLMPVGKLNTNYVTRDEEMRMKMSKDPLRYHGGVRARWAIACHEELFRIQESVGDVTWPFLLLHGINDRLCSPEASKLFYKNARSNDKKLKMFPGAFHHLFLEIPEVRKEALQDTVDWIKARLPKEDSLVQ